MSSSSSSKSKRPDLDRKLLVQYLKARQKYLKRSIKEHVQRKQYGDAAFLKGLMDAYWMMAEDIEKGIYDVIPKEKLGPRR